MKDKTTLGDVKQKWITVNKEQCDIFSSLNDLTEPAVEHLKKVRKEIDEYPRNESVLPGINAHLYNISTRVNMALFALDPGWNIPKGEDRSKEEKPKNEPKRKDGSKIGWEKLNS